VIKPVLAAYYISNAQTKQWRKE